MSFSASESAFEGFRVVRRHPLAIVFWALAYILFFIAFFAVAGGGLASFMAAAESMEGGSPTPEDLQALSMSYMSFAGLAMPFGLLLSAVLSSAVARAVLFPQQSAFGYMRLGADELRVIAVNIILGLVVFAVGFVLFGVAAAVGAATYQANSGLAVLIGVLLGLGALVALIWLALRLSLAVPVTVAEKRIAPFASFALTKGKALPLLGMAIIACVMAILVSLLGGIISMPLTMLAGGGLEGMAALDGQSPMQIFQAMGPMLIVAGVLNAIFSALQLAVVYAPFAAAYRDLKGLPRD